MKRPQIMVALGGIVLLALLYFFAQSVPPRSKAAPVSQAGEVSSGEKAVNTQQILQASEARLTPSQSAYVNRLENSVVRGDVSSQQIKAYHQLAGFWRDSVDNGFLPAAYYTAEAAKLENSEKSLTFAAQIFLDNLRGQDNPALKSWMANQAKGLFEKALQINPLNDSSKVGLGGCYIFGAAGNPQEVMQGVQQVLEVAHRDSTNMYAQFMLGLGGVESGQFDKAIERLTRVVGQQPRNVEAMLVLAEACDRTGDKANAIKWYRSSEKLVSNPELTKEIDQRIKILE